MSDCKGCGAQIVWIKIGSGKSMPCDPELVTYWQKDKAAGKVVTPNGEVLSCEFKGNLEDATGIGYRSHFASCPNADAFRKK